MQFKHDSEFKSLLKEFEKLPNYKQLVNSMILFDDMYGYKGSFDPNFLVDLFGIFGSKRSYRRAMIYSTNKDLVKTLDDKGNKKLLLTSSKKKVLFNEIPIYKLQKQRWDKKWTVVMYDIEENNYLRRSFRKKLKSLGFGTIQRSIMVSPLFLHKELSEFVKKKKLEDHILVFRSENILGMTNKMIAKEAFNLVFYKKLYDELIHVYKKSDFNERTNLRKKWIRYYLALINSDPHLPKELLPSDWSADKCKNYYKNIISKLYITL